MCCNFFILRGGKNLEAGGTRGCGRRKTPAARSRLAGLHFDGTREVHGAAHRCSDGEVLAVLDVAVEDAGFLPLEAPGVFDSDDGVHAGDHASDAEGAV